MTLCERLSPPVEVTSVNRIREALLARIAYHDSIIPWVPTHYSQVIRNELASLARELGWGAYLPGRPV